MKILEVIDICDKLFPNEFDMKEKIMWCNEVGSSILTEHMHEYDTVGVKIKNGSLELPPDIEYTDIAKIIIGGKFVEKKDGRWFGKNQLFVPKGSMGIPICESGAGEKTAKILCKRKYENIRDTALKSVIVSIENNLLYMTGCPFMTGDIITINIGSSSYCVTVENIDSEGNSRFTLTLDTDMGSEKNIIVDMERIITDETVVRSPFDTMYLDYLNSKICFYQRDYDSYNKHMALFNSRLEDFDRYWAKVCGTSPDTTLKNWW